MECFNNHNEWARCAKCGAMGSAMEPHSVHWMAESVFGDPERLVVTCRRCGWHVNDYAPRDVERTEGA